MTLSRGAVVAIKWVVMVLSIFFLGGCANENTIQISDSRSVCAKFPKGYALIKKSTAIDNERAVVVSGAGEEIAIEIGTEQEIYISNPPAAELNKFQFLGRYVQKEHQFFAWQSADSQISRYYVVFKVPMKFDENLFSASGFLSQCKNS
jgi:hypothetical protein